MENLTTLPKDWPPLTEVAQSLAKEIWMANAIRFNEYGWDIVELNDDNEHTTEGFHITVLAQIDLLSDLMRPASRDFWVRWLAEKMRLPVHDFSIAWFRNDYGDGGHWTLSSSSSNWVQFANAWNDWQRSSYRYSVPGISALMHPAAALRLTLLTMDDIK